MVRRIRYLYRRCRSNRNKKQQKALLLHLGGRELREVYKPMKDDNDNFDDICTKLDTYFRPRKNITYERFKL